jgi:hypothetical protein
MRPTCSRSRLNEFRSFLFQLGISTLLARKQRRYLLDILVDTFQSDHTLFELYEPPYNKEETLLDGTRECERESRHGGIYTWRKKAGKGSKPNNHCREDIESGYASADSTLQKIYGVPESHLFTVLP